MTPLSELPILPEAPLTHFFGSEILATGDLFGSVKDAGIFLGRKKNGGVFWVAKKELTKGIFWGMLKKVVIFMGRQTLKL